MPVGAIKPRDAAGLILLRDGRTGDEVLLGRRHAKARFMPGVYVFPGGGLDRADSRPSGLRERFARPHPNLDRASHRRHHAFVRAALREFYEETGFLLGTPRAAAADRTPSDPAWRAYAAAGLDPAFAALRLVARAITPAAHPIRFHTRFFLAAGRQDLAAVGPGDGELEEIGWYPVAAALGELPTPGITEKVLMEALTARAHFAERRSFAPVRFTARGARLYIRRQ